jgi:hypothetical protein
VDEAKNDADGKIAPIMMPEAGQTGSGPPMFF